MGNRNIRILGRDDQLVVAICLSIFLIVCTFYFWHRSVVNGGMIDFEDMPGHQAAYQVDINYADWPEFANLPGIGEKLAKDIVRHRELYGRFECPDALKEVVGIGDAKMEAMRSYLALVDDNRSATFTESKTH